jgi:hypothetical protein
MARWIGSPDSCSTTWPSGAMTSAAFAGITGLDTRIAPMTKPKMMNSRIRCRNRRTQSRPRPIAKKTAPILPMS